MQNAEGTHHHSDGGDRASFSGPQNKMAGGKKSLSRFTLPADDSTSSAVEIAVEESVAVQSVTAVGGGAVKDPQQKMVVGGLEKKTSFVSSVVRNASSRIRQVPQELKRLASITPRHQPEPAGRRLDRTKTAAAHALNGLKFISKRDGAAWTAVDKEFDKLTHSTDGLLSRSQFAKCIGMKGSEEFAGRLFDTMTRRRHISGESISKDQLKDFWDQLADQSFDSRLQTFFDMVDKDADGRITEDEVSDIITLSASANRLSNIQKQADEYARLIMKELDPENLGYIMIERLETLLLQSGRGGGGESRDLSKTLSKQLKLTEEHLLKRWYSHVEYFLVDNWQRVWVVALWIGVMAALFSYKYVQYRKKGAFEVMGHCVCMAKGAAETLKLNMALILLPMCRNTITWLRNRTSLGVAVPFDNSIDFHQMIAVAIAIGIGIHAISHLTCDFPRLLSASAEKYEPMKQYFGDEQPTSYWHFVKGWEGVTGIVMVVLMGIAFTLASPIFRRNCKLKENPNPLDKLRGFNAFWYSHHLFIIVYTLLIVHGINLYFTHEWYHKTTWMYLAIPITLYAGERLIRAFRSSIKAVKILKAVVYPGNVVTLHMSKPQGFKYKSGQYIFVNCAAVSPFEWHPFSITSAPSDDYLSVHIRAVGDWTNQLKLVFSKFCQSLPAEKNGLLRADFPQGENNPNVPKILIDGPYGAPTQDYKDYDVVLLIGLGIGVTPMISVVKDIVNNIKAMEEEENSMEEGSGDKTDLTLPSPTPKGSVNDKHNFKIKRAYFYWMTRDQGSFDWFKGVMDEVDEMDHGKVVEVHNYCTSVYEEGDARSTLITMLQSINHAKNGVDIVAGTRVMSHFARPNWKTVYKSIALNHPNSRVGVFYCGAAAPVTELRNLAHDFSHKTSTKFHFHKENF